MRPKKTYKLGNSIRVKLLLIISLITLVAIFIVSMAFYYMSHTQILDLIEQRNLQISRVVAQIIKGDYIQDIFTQEDNVKLAYRNLVNKLDAVNDSVEMGQLYIIVKQGEDSYKAYITNETDEFTIVNLQGEYELSSKFIEIFKSGKDTIVKGEYNIGGIEKQYTSAFSPIINNDNEVIAIVGYDYENEDFKDMVTDINVDILHIGLALITVCMAAQYFILSKVFGSINEIVEIINIITKGDMTVKIDVPTLDEIGVVKQALNNNISTISKILSTIKISSTQLDKASKSIFISSRDGVDSFNELSKAIIKISDVAQIQKNNQIEAMNILERLSNDGDNISKHTQNMKLQIEKVHLLLIESKNRDRKLYDDLKVIEEELSVLMLNSNDYLDEMAEHIKQAFYNIDEAGQLVSNIEEDTESVIGIVEEQIASSEEFMNMTSLLKAEAKKVNENVNIFKV